MQPDPANLDWADRWPSLEELGRDRGLRVVDDGETATDVERPSAPATRRPTITIAEPERSGWHDPALAGEARLEIERLERAITHGRKRAAARARRRLLRTMQHDRVAQAYSLAAELHLDLEPAGIGPLVSQPKIHRGSGRTWRVCPVDASRTTPLPGHATAIKTRWQQAGYVFDRFYLAYEFKGSADVLNGNATPCLIGVVAGDGWCGHWFVLDRWTG